MKCFSHSAFVVASALTVALTSLPGLAMAQSPDQPKPMALRGIMLELQSNTDAASAAISKEDWKTVAEIAPKIAHHATPPLLEKVRILAWLNVDALKFRGLDVQVEKAATAMGEAAKRDDRKAVVADFARVQQSCVACHSGYRQQFIKHFYGE